VERSVVTANQLSWESPEVRAVVPLDLGKVARWKTKRRTPHSRLQDRTNGDFEQVLRNCAEPRDNDLTLS
jgi:Leu/Phe-tRNA-protein transferase